MKRRWCTYHSIKNASVICFGQLGIGDGALELLKIQMSHAVRIILLKDFTKHTNFGTGRLVRDHYPTRIHIEQMKWAIQRSKHSQYMKNECTNPWVRLVVVSNNWRIDIDYLWPNPFPRSWDFARLHQIDDSTKRLLSLHHWLRDRLDQRPVNHRQRPCQPWKFASTYVPYIRIF